MAAKPVGIDVRLEMMCGVERKMMENGKSTSSERADEERAD